MTVEMTQHSYLLGIRGEHSSQVEFVCDITEWEATARSYLGTSDAISPNLVCKSVRAHPLKNDWNTGKMVLNLDYAPKLSIDAMTIDLPLKWRLEMGSECVTIKGNYKWSDGDALHNQRVLPVKRFTIEKLVLYGTRSSFNLATYVSYLDHVNSDTFLGASAETLFFESMRAQQHQFLDGTIVYAIELHLIHKPSGFNLFFREDREEGDDEFQVLLDSDGNKVYPSTSFAGLLS